MEEAKTRFRVVNTIVEQGHIFPVGIIREICYLQFRCLCEIIALGCLTAHGDVTQSKFLKKTYEPGKILKALDSLKDIHYYPQPSDVVATERGRGFIARPDRNHLTKSEVTTLWNLSGDVLHRAPLTKIRGPRRRGPADLSGINEWGAKLTGLLNCHWITIDKNRKGIMVYLATEPNGPAGAELFRFDNKNQVAEVLRVKAPLPRKRQPSRQPDAPQTQKKQPQPPSPSGE